MPLIRHGLGLSYAQIGLLASLPILVGSFVELPLGILAGYGRRRRRVAMGGGLLFVAALFAVAGATDFALLLGALVVFYPASGAFVSLTEADLMDAYPARREHAMAAWTAAGSVGAILGPLLVIGALWTGASWRAAFLVVAAAAVAAWAPLVWRGGSTPASRIAASSPTAASDPAVASNTGCQGQHHSQARPAEPPTDGAPTGGENAHRTFIAAIKALRGPALRWLVLLQVTDLLGDVLTGFLAVYLVAVANAPAWMAAAAVGVRIAAGLLGELALIALLARGVSAFRVLRSTALIALVAFPAFLLLPGTLAKLPALAVLSLATCTWYPLLQAQLFGCLDGQSAVAVTLSSGAALVGAVGPLGIGLAAGKVGLAPALAVLTGVPMAVLVGLRVLRPGRSARNGALR